MSMSSANRANGAGRAAHGAGWYAAWLGVVVTRWACGVIARMYVRLAVLQWWWQVRREPVAAQARWRRRLTRRRLERELGGALLEVYAAGVARGLCGEDRASGRRLVQQVGGLWRGAKRAPVHFGLLLKSLSLASGWQGRLLLACSEGAG
jgi:hypothetical protein